MKRIKYILLITFFNVKAENSCSSDDLTNLKELANNIEIRKNIHVDESPNKEEFDDTVYYTVDIINYDYNLIIRYKRDDMLLELPVSELEDTWFWEGENITFYVYSFVNGGCINNLLKSIKIKFEDYNLYYYNNKDKCSEYPNFKYCKEYTDIEDKDFSEIDKEFEEYIASNPKKEENNNNNSNNNSIKNNNLIYYVAGGTLIVVIIVIIFILVRRRNKNKDRI